MQIVFIDSTNWLQYSVDDAGCLWLTDYPDSGLHGGGVPRIRKLAGAPKVLSAFHNLLNELAGYSKELNENSTQTRWHLASIGEIAEALTMGLPLGASIQETKQAFGRSFLPDAWGEFIKVGWEKFLIEVYNPLP